jgi:hypothetical protein
MLHGKGRRAGATVKDGEEGRKDWGGAWSTGSWRRNSPPQRGFHTVSKVLESALGRFEGMKRLASLSSSNHAKIPFFTDVAPYLMCMKPP